MFEGEAEWPRKTACNYFSAQILKIVRRLFIHQAVSGLGNFARARCRDEPQPSQQKTRAFGTGTSFPVSEGV
jgi:hypothetical protein